MARYVMFVIHDLIVSLIIVEKAVWLGNQIVCIQNGVDLLVCVCPF